VNFDEIPVEFVYWSITGWLGDPTATISMRQLEVTGWLYKSLIIEEIARHHDAFSKFSRPFIALKDKPP
jgi:hypothetical protein